MADEPNWEPEIHYPRLADTLIEEDGDEQAKILFTDLMAGRWSIYADGYRRAGNALVDTVQGEPPDDMLLLPIVFLYRHFVELTLKDLFLRLGSLCHIGIDPKQVTTHKLILTQIRRIFDMPLIETLPRWYYPILSQRQIGELDRRIGCSHGPFLVFARLSISKEAAQRPRHVC